MAKLLEEAGFKIEIIVEHRDAQFFSDGDVMTGATTYVHVHADGPNDWDDRYSFGFESHETCKYGRAGTSFLSGHLYPPAWSSRRSRKLNLKELRSRIGTEMDHARYAKTQEA